MFPVKSRSAGNEPLPALNERAYSERQDYRLRRVSEQLRARLNKVLLAGGCSASRAGASFPQPPAREQE